VSSFGSDFNFDFGVSFSREDVANERVSYNFGTSRGHGSEELPGLSVFARDEAGAVFHTYSTYARGLDILVGAYNLLDLVPKGRDEDDLPFTMQWLRHHDRYGDVPARGRLGEASQAEGAGARGVEADAQRPGPSLIRTSSRGASQA
jgi:predicted dithiol-disulfide oxidoreductase (DUF899 family)